MKLFCRHDFKEVNRYYKKAELEDYHLFNITYLITVYKRYRCKLCNKVKIEKVDNKTYCMREAVSCAINELKIMGYEDYRKITLQ